MGILAGLMISVMLLVLFSPVIAIGYFAVRWPVNRVIGPEHQNWRRVAIVATLLVVGKILFSI